MKKKCEKDELEVCDFCLHFNMFRDKNGGNIDGFGHCGLHRKVVEAGEGCKDYYCEFQWEKNMRVKY